MSYDPTLQHRGFTQRYVLLLLDEYRMVPPSYKLVYKPINIH